MSAISYPGCVIGAALLKISVNNDVNYNSIYALACACSRASSAAFSSPTTAMDVNLSRIVFLLLAASSQTYCQSECISYMKYLYAMDTRAGSGAVSSK